jgi:hypothetical protein
MRCVPLAALVLGLVLTGAAGGSSREPGPLRGVPLGAGTGLRLVVAAVPPFMLDVDSGRVIRVPGVPRQKRGVLWVVGVGGSGAAIVAKSAPQAKIYGVRRNRVSNLGAGTDATPAGNGRSVWIKAGRSSCSLRQVALDGRQLRAPRPYRCASTLRAGGTLGLVVNRTRVIDPVTGRTVLRTRSGIVAVVGRRLLLDESPGVSVTLMDATTGGRRTLRLPRTIGSLGTAAVDPQGRFVALEFGNPSWTSGPGQAFDVWLLDAVTGKLTPLPDLPAFVALKRTNMVWTDDGRLVLLAQSGGRDAVVVWRPGQERLAIKLVQLPDRGRSGSDSFALLR